MIITNEKKGLGKYPQEVIKLENEIQEVASNLVLVNSQLSEGIANAERNIQNVIARQGLSIETMNLFAENARLIDTELQFANIDNANMNNAYIENLVVNRPVFDMILNDAHLDNVGVTSGNLYNVNLFNFAVPSLVEIEPEERSSAIGFDGEGHLIPIHTIADISLPKNAGFIRTDETGSPLKGVASDVIDDSDNLVTARGIKQALLDNLEEVMPVINALKEVGAVEVNTGALRNAVQDGDSISGFKVRGFSGGASGVPVGGGCVYTREPVGSTNIGVLSIPGFVYKAEEGEMVNVFEGTNISGTVNFTLPVDVKMLRSTFKDCYAISTFDSAIPSSVNQLPFTFANCFSLTTFTDKVKLPSNLESMAGTFQGCISLVESNLFERIPQSCNYFWKTFDGCNNFNQPLAFTNELVDTTYMMFNGCSNFNSEITGTNIKNASNMFSNCSSFNAPINLEYVQNADGMFANCASYNQPLTFNIYNGTGVFADCIEFNQNIDFANQTGGGHYNNWFINCVNLDQNFVIPLDGTDVRRVLAGIDGMFKNTGLTNMPTFTVDGEEYKWDTPISSAIVANNAFAYCNKLQADEIELPPLRVADNMFRLCENLHPSEITFPPLPQGHYTAAMVKNMFYGCGLARAIVYIPRGETNLQNALTNGATGFTFNSQRVIPYNP